MKLVMQRVLSASVDVNQKKISSIGRGLLVFVGLASTDTDENIDMAWFVKKCVKLRVFEDEVGKMNRSLLDMGLEILIVSQFTLCADVRSGNRPSFTTALHPEKAEKLYENFCEAVGAEIGANKVKKGQFGAEMKVSLVNDGPVTFYVEK